MLERGEGGPRDDLAAAKLYERPCEKGDHYACANLAYLLTDGKGVEHDDVKANELAKRACDEGKLKSACNQLGVSYEHGRKVDKSLAKAAELFERACDTTYPLACANYGSVLIEQSPGADSEKKAYPFYEKACAGKTARGCFLLGDAREFGKGTKKDMAKAVEAYGDGCDAVPAFDRRLRARRGGVRLRQRCLPRRGARGVALQEGLRRRLCERLPEDRRALTTVQGGPASMARR